MQAAHQISIFDSGPPGFDSRLRGLDRTELGEGAWVDYLPQWVEGHGRVFRELNASADWRSLRRRMYDREVDVPRLVASRPEAGPAARLLGRLSGALSMHYQRSLAEIALNLYRNGEDSVAPHGDRVGERAGDTVIAIVSVGAPRAFCLRSVSGRGRARRFALGWGDLLVMGGTCQRTWTHAVPKARHADPRISVMFRESVPPEPVR